MKASLKKIFPVLIFCCGLACLSLAAGAATQPFSIWLQGMRQAALGQGVSASTVDLAFAGLSPLQRVLDLDRKQPEKTMTFARYRQQVISHARISKGRELMRQNAALLHKAEKQYGVPAAFIVALWGIETSFGENTGGFDVIAALATLAWDGRRSSFFSNELIKALHILDEGHVERGRMKGSWAGAMGQNQFMPSSFEKFAVDGDGDGRKNIWSSRPDVFASTAHYLSASGWRPGERWGREVRLPQGFSPALVGLEVRKEPAAWQALGVRLPGGENLPDGTGMKASVVAPDGLGGPAYLVYNNYRVIMLWNRSTYFATSVGLIADSLSGY